MAKDTVRFEMAEARQLSRKFKGMGDAVQKDVDLEIGRITGRLVARIRGKIPARSGRARASVQARKGKFTAGGPAAPHYPWLDFGGYTKVRGSRPRVYRKYIKEGRYIFPTVSGQDKANAAAMEKAVARTAKKHGLEAK